MQYDSNVEALIHQHNGLKILSTINNRSLIQRGSIKSDSQFIIGPVIILSFSLESQYNRQDDMKYPIKMNGLCYKIDFNANHTLMYNKNIFAPYFSFYI